MFKTLGTGIGMIKDDPLRGSGFLSDDSNGDGTVNVDAKWAKSRRQAFP